MRTTERRNGPNHLTWNAVATVVIALLAGRPAAAVEVDAGDWKLTANGNVNVHYIHASCEEETVAPVGGGLACFGAAGEDKSSSISNGLLPAALAIGASTTQKGLDLTVKFGFYPGISTNDGSPNLQQGADPGLLNTALGTTAIDMREVYMTFGNDSMGTFLLGRAIGLFGADAILNDMTLPGVGAVTPGGNAAPANTSLGSIGLGYIYTDWLGQINYTTPDLSGFKLTIGIFDPLEPVAAGAPTPEGSPGYHAKVAYENGPVYVSATFIAQKHEGLVNANDFDSRGFDVGGKFTFGDLEIMGWYYNGKGMGTTALYLLASPGGGQERDSDGFLAQVTYKIGDTKVGVNFGQSNLDLASGEVVSDLVETNEKYTVGVYHSLTENLTLLAEFTDTTAEAHSGLENDSTNINIGAFLSF
ncbi:MAG TPA: porin [Steroidobacter sp.]|uniref:porin n=1 Tax=Steroidobacter sp. TaxID=1978227 RepID=UPI002ED8D3EC